MEPSFLAKEEFRQYHEKLQKKLDHKRYEHTLGVAYTAACMAMAHGESVEKAYLAGLLHDNAKCLSEEKKKVLCKKYELIPSAAEVANHDLLHAKLGAYQARDKYGVQDAEIISAIMWHTTGKPDMTTLEKIIYIADFIEPGRKKYYRMDEVRRHAFTDLDTAMYLILENTIMYLEQKGAVIDEITKETFAFYKSCIKDIF